MVKREDETIDESFFVQLGVQKGIDAIIKKHPRFKSREKEILAHIDKTRLKERVYGIYQNLEGKRLSEKQRRNYIVNELTDYVSTGMALDDEGKEIIVLKGLEEKASKGFIRGHQARKMLRGEAYLDRGLGLAHNLSYIMETGNYTKKMPEIAEAASTLEDMQLLDPVIKAMKYNGILNDKEYRFLQNRVYKKARSAEAGIKSGIEKYVASIIGILGILFIAFSSQITGAVVGDAGKFEGGIIGIIFIIFSLTLFLVSFAKDSRKFKNK